MSEHLAEPREDLEYRFRFMASVVLKARDLSAFCVHDGCPSCIALREAVPVPDSVRDPSHEPREDLEQAVVSINDRIETVVDLPANGCPGRNYIYGLLRDATERLNDAS